ncbi:MAG: hydrogenase [Lentisphaerae bacterium]|nr:hydrogenase [Lentisphaerota bacterium]
MMPLVDSVHVLILVTCLLLLGSSRLGACIRTVAIQGIVAGGVLPWVSSLHISMQLLFTGVFVMALKGIVFPVLLSRAMREASASREMSPFVGYGTSLMAGVLFFLASLWLGAKLPTPDGVSGLAVPTACMMVSTGLFLIIARRLAVTQVIGYIVVENGIYALGLAVAHDIPVLVELGAMLDAFVAVFVMGIAIFHINREFDHMDSGRLNVLKG